MDLIKKDVFGRSLEYLASYHNCKESSTPFFDLDIEYALQESVSLLIKDNLIESAHDVADGGLFITLLECSMYRDLGFNINSVNDIRKDAFLFGESPSRVVVSIDPEKKNDFEEFMSSKKTEITLLGEVSDGQLSVDNKSFGTSIEYKGIYNSSLSDIMN